MTNDEIIAEKAFIWACGKNTNNRSNTKQRIVIKKLVIKMSCWSS